jgi:hypothetical protein
MTWPIGRGRDFVGALDIAFGAVRLLDDAALTNPPAGAARPMDPRQSRLSTRRLTPRRWRTSSRWSAMPAAVSTSSRSAMAI